VRAGAGGRPASPTIALRGARSHQSAAAVADSSKTSATAPVRRHREPAAGTPTACGGILRSTSIDGTDGVLIVGDGGTPTVGDGMLIAGDGGTLIVGVRRTLIIGDGGMLIVGARGVIIAATGGVFVTTLGARRAVVASGSASVNPCTSDATRSESRMTSSHASTSA